MKTNYQFFLRANKSALHFSFVFSTIFLLSFQPASISECAGLPPIRREVKIENRFQSIRIYGDLNVVLTNDLAGTIIADGLEKDLNRITYSVKNNILSIDANRSNGFSRLTLFLSAVTLHSIMVNGDIDISSHEAIQPGNLYIFLNGNSHLNVKTKGKLIVDAPNDYDLLWESPFAGNFP